MIEQHEQFAEDFKGVTLTTSERASIRANLQAATQLARPRPAAWAFLMRHATALGMLTLLATGGTAIAGANRSLPGDLLYPLRVAVNDRVAIVAAGNEEARLEAELRQFERLAEEEEAIALESFAQLIVEGEPDDQEGDDVSDDDAQDDVQIDAGIEIDLEAEAELRDLERLLDAEESAAEIELSL